VIIWTYSVILVKITFIIFNDYKSNSCSQCCSEIHVSIKKKNYHHLNLTRKKNCVTFGTFPFSRFQCMYFIFPHKIGVVWIILFLTLFFPNMSNFSPISNDFWKCAPRIARHFVLLMSHSLFSYFPKVRYLQCFSIFTFT